MSTILQLKEALGSGLRTDKYSITLSVPAATGVPADAVAVTSVLCKSASFPAKTVGQTEFYKLGRKAIMPGEVEYENTWDLTFYEKEDASMRQVFITWMSALSDYLSHNDSNAGLVSELIISNLKSDGSVGQTYKFFNAYPQNVSSIELSDESVNTLGEFTVTFSFDYWESV